MKTLIKKTSLLLMLFSYSYMMYSLNFKVDGIYYTTRTSNNNEMAVHYLLKAANNGNGKAKLYLNKIM